jgi:methyltransferase (TIGR00027 family)
LDESDWLNPVGKTALSVARVRARESRRADRLFHDPFAEAFVAATEPIPASEGSPGDPDAVARTRGRAFHVVIRTRFYDDYLLAANAAGCHQVVVLGAGLDARAFRLPWVEDSRLFELDQPALLAFKFSVLVEQGAVPRGNLTAVPVDLRQDWSSALLAAGYDPGRRTAWLAEGLLVYLDASEAGRLLESVTRLSRPGDRLAMERGSTAPPIFSGLGLGSGADHVTALWQGGLGSDPHVWLAQHGWQTEAHDLGDLAARYGRPAATSTRSSFVTAIYSPTDN